MKYYEVVKVIYLGDSEENLLKYELFSNGNEEVSGVNVFETVKIIGNGQSFPVWIKVDTVALDHLDPPQIIKVGFQTGMRGDLFPCRSIGSAIEECKKHRSKWYA
jgi:hypothetical protein